jgi:hypothetical protein
MGADIINLAELVSESLKFPFSDVKRLLSLGLLMATSILIIPLILAYGYSLRIIEHSFEGSNELPPFNDWFGMFTDGLKYIVVMIVYVGIPVIIASIISTMIIMSVLLGAGTANLDFNTFLNTSLAIMFVVVFIIVIFPFILSLMALPHIVKTNKLESLFKFKDILGIIKNIGWGRYISASVLIIAFTMVVSILSWVPQILNMNQISIYLISAVIGLFIGSYVSAFKARFQALLYQEGIEELE